MSEYWTICAEEALESAGLSATTEQVALVAESMEMAHDCYGEQHGHHEADRSLWADLTRRAESAEARARREEGKVPCPVCAGKKAPGLGGTTEPARYSCDYCHRSGKVDPGQADRWA